MTKKIKLSFINEGKEFEAPHITVKMQEEILEEMSKLDSNKMSKEKYNSILNRSFILKVLNKIDDKVTVKHIDDMHPEDFITLFGIIWEGGRELVSDDEGNFRKTK